jgi:hypothetical protein
VPVSVRQVTHLTVLGVGLVLFFSAGPSVLGGWKLAWAPG